MKLSRPITHIIFDMDGVLLDTERFYTQATQQIVGKFGKTFNWSIKANMMGLPAMEAATYLTNVLELPISPEQYLKQREQILVQLAPFAQPMPGAVRLVQSLCRMRVPLGIATSSSRMFFDLKTTNHQDWLAGVRVVVVGDDPRLQAGKPAPDIFLLAADDLDAKATDCLVIEDSIAGVQAAHAADMQVLAVPYPGMDPTRLAEADLLIESLQELELQDLGLV